MKRVYLILVTVLLHTAVYSQTIKEFSRDTALYASELKTFMESHTEPANIPDFVRFLQLYDSLPFEHRMEIIDASNLMLYRKSKPQPHFIKFQRVMMEFFLGGKTAHGYDEWLEGFNNFLRSDAALLRTIDRWLSLSLELLKDNVCYTSGGTTWKVSTPGFRFHTERNMLILFDDVTLVCLAGKDSILIQGASGYINPLVQELIGTGGTVTWERAGVPQTQIYATLHDYRINLKSSHYVADSTTLYYPTLFKGVALGKLEDKVTQVNKPSSMLYPQFVSYQNSYSIKDLVPGIHYRGGLSIEGPNLLGSGVEGRPAVLDFYAGDTLRVKALFQRVSMNTSRIRSQHASVSIYLGVDSIYHPDLQLSFDVAKDELRLNQTQDYKSMGPYSNSFHNIDMNFDELFWKRSEPVMKFQAMQGSSIGRATFESNTYFDYDFYEKLQGMDYVHPLAQLYTYSNMLGGRTFALPNYANYLGYSLYQVRHQLMSLSKLGFVYYDDASDMITLRQKLFDYITASMRQRDYDVIRFISRTTRRANARLDLYSRDLTIAGIPVIFLSDSQNVKLIPDETTIVMKKNRSFQFDGVVDAGQFRFTGDNFFFDYDSFKIDLQNIDSLQMSIFTGQVNQHGNLLQIMIDNAIEDMVGELLIDEPQNKSGQKYTPEYPIFTSKTGSYIYFDHENIQGGVYDRETFYFKLKPFTIDSLDNFKPEGLRPRGTFVSAGILPTLELEMSLRDDNSLGFYLEAPGEGIPLYGGLGTFYNDLEMSNKGLWGYGSFDYLTSTTWSDEFLMHPDSLMARSRRFLIRERLEERAFPFVENTVADIKLIPAEEVMKIARVKETFRIFSDSIYHGGDLALRPAGLSGNGVLALPEARFASDLFRYGSRTIQSDSAGVELKDHTVDEFPFQTNDVNMHVDLNRRIGEFWANGDATLITFPYNLYETRLNHLIWYMDRNEVAMASGKIVPDSSLLISLDPLVPLVPDGQSPLPPEDSLRILIDSATGTFPTYLSVHPRQDSLHFSAPFATYNYTTRMLRASRVPFIEVADVYIIPDGGRIEVGAQATMNLLENAKIVASKTSRQHLIYNSSVLIDGAMDFSGTGYYDYHDDFGNSHQLYFKKIWVDTTSEMRAIGEILDDDPFMLSPFFDFKGDVSLSASAPFLTFDGGLRTVHDCPIGRDWLRITTLIDPKDIRIPIPEQMQNMALNKIFAGSMITHDSIHIFSTFLTGRKDYFDLPITSASGILLYDPEISSYIISTPEKIDDPALPGRYLRLETDKCLLYSEGPVDLTLDYGKVTMVAAGNTTHRADEDLFTAHLVLGLDFPFSQEALQVMGYEIDSLPNLEPVDLTSEHYQLAIRDLLGEDLAGELEKQLILTGGYEEIPGSFFHTIFFDDLPLKWNQETRSFRHNGKIGIGNIGDVQVNKKVNAYVELVEKGSGDILDIYLQVDRRTWYYFAYSPGSLQVLSSNKKFNKIIFDLKPSERRVKTKLGQAQYIYSLAAPRRLELFINRFLEYEQEETPGGEF